jgi:hypothetical protein
MSSALRPLTLERRVQAACEAALLLNEAVRELVIPRRIFALTENVPEGPVDIQWLSGIRHVVLQSIILAIFRVSEIRTWFLVDWLFTDAELRERRFPPVEEFIGRDRWSDFLICRHNYAGHASAAPATEREPAKLVPAKHLGRALRRCGLVPHLEKFLDRVNAELATGVEITVAELRFHYPAVDRFVREQYPTELSRETHRTDEGQQPR